MYLLKVILSEEVKDDVDGLLKCACGETKNIKHCKCRDSRDIASRRSTSISGPFLSTAFPLGVRCWPLEASSALPPVIGCSCAPFSGWLLAMGGEFCATPCDWIQLRLIFLWSLSLDVRHGFARAG